MFFVRVSFGHPLLLVSSGAHPELTYGCLFRLSVSPRKLSSAFLRTMVSGWFTLCPMIEVGILLPDLLSQSESKEILSTNDVQIRTRIRVTGSKAKCATH